jgi:hypothetical protein
VLGHEGKPATVVDVSEEVRPLPRQALHEREEALVGGLATQSTKELDQARLVVGPDGTEAHLCSVVERHLAL